MEYELKCLDGDEPRILVTDEFVENNKLMINPAKALEIMEDETSFFGFGKEVASDYLNFEQCKKFLKKEFIEKYEAGEEFKMVTDIKEAAQDFLDYMVFAWMKAMDERGISASRSIEKLAAWMKILNRDDVADVLGDDNLYNPYGRPALKKACEMLGIEHPENL